MTGKSRPFQYCVSLILSSCVYIGGLYLSHINTSHHEAYFLGGCIISLILLGFTSYDAKKELLLRSLKNNLIFLAGTVLAIASYLCIWIAVVVSILRPSDRSEFNTFAVLGLLFLIAANVVLNVGPAIWQKLVAPKQINDLCFLAPQIWGDSQPFRTIHGHVVQDPYRKFFLIGDGMGYNIVSLHSLGDGQATFKVEINLSGENHTHEELFEYRWLYAVRLIPRQYYLSIVLQR